MAATEAANREMARGITDVAAAMTRMSENESANADYPNADPVMQVISAMEANMAQI